MKREKVFKKQGWTGFTWMGEVSLVIFEGSILSINVGHSWNITKLVRFGFEKGLPFFKS